jgi:hypothetical protein
MELSVIILLGTAISLLLLVGAGLIYTYVRSTTQEEEHTTFRGMVDQLKATASSVYQSISTNSDKEKQLAADVLAAKAKLRSGIDALRSAADSTDAALQKAIAFSTSLDPNLEISLTQVENGHADAATAVTESLKEVLDVSVALELAAETLEAIPAIAPQASAPTWYTTDARLTSLKTTQQQAMHVRDDMIGVLRGLDAALSGKVVESTVRQEQAGWKAEWADMQARLLALTASTEAAFTTRVADVATSMQGVDVAALQGQASSLGGNIAATKLCLKTECIDLTKLLG